MSRGEVFLAVMGGLILALGMAGLLWTLGTGR
jgi:hypothetical protein